MPIIKYIKDDYKLDQELLESYYVSEGNSAYQNITKDQNIVLKDRKPIPFEKALLNPKIKK